MLTRLLFDKKNSNIVQLFCMYFIADGKTKFSAVII